MKIIKIILLSALAVLIAAQGAGCMIFDKERNNSQTTAVNSIDDVKSMLLSHLSEKYDCEFECVGQSGPTLLEKIYTFMVVKKAENYDVYGFFAYYYPEDNAFEDGYQGILLRDEIEQLVKPCLDKNEKVFVEISSKTFNDKYDKNSRLSDIAPIRLYLYIFSDTQAPDFDEINKVLVSEKISGTIKFYKVDSETLEKTDYENYPDTVSDIVAGLKKCDEALSVDIA